MFDIPSPLGKTLATIDPCTCGVSSCIIAPGDVVVQVTEVDDGAHDVALPIPDKGEAETMETAVASQSYLLWPRRLIDIRVRFCFTFICIYTFYSQIMLIIVYHRID